MEGGQDGRVHVRPVDALKQEDLSASRARMEGIKHHQLKAQDLKLSFALSRQGHIHSLINSEEKRKWFKALNLSAFGCGVLVSSVWKNFVNRHQYIPTKS